MAPEHRYDTGNLHQFTPAADMVLADTVLPAYARRVMTRRESFQVCLIMGALVVLWFLHWERVGELPPKEEWSQSRYYALLIVRRVTYLVFLPPSPLPAALDRPVTDSQRFEAI